MSKDLHTTQKSAAKAGKSNGSTPDAPGADDIGRALAALLESADFAASSRNRKFLAHVVERSLRGEKTTAYEIATKIFGRAETFDHLDPIVRIEASKLRRDLEVYYLKSGKAEPVRIGFPKGRYRATFAWNEDRGGAVPHARASGALLRAALLGLSGEREEAAEAWCEVLQHHPKFPYDANAQRALEALHGNDGRSRDLLREGLKRAANGSARESMFDGALLHEAV